MYNVSNLTVLVESEIKYKKLHKNVEKRELQVIYKKRASNMIVLLLAMYRGIDRVSN